VLINVTAATKQTCSLTDKELKQKTSQIITIWSDRLLFSKVYYHTLSCYIM